MAPSLKNDLFIKKAYTYLKKKKRLFKGIKEIINQELANLYHIPNVCYIAQCQGKIVPISKDIKHGKQFVSFLFLLLKNPNLSTDLVTLCDILYEKIRLDKQDILQMATVMFQNYLLFYSNFLTVSVSY